MPLIEDLLRVYDMVTREYRLIRASSTEKFAYRAFVSIHYQLTDGKKKEGTLHVPIQLLTPMTSHLHLILLIETIRVHSIEYKMLWLSYPIQPTLSMLHLRLVLSQDLTLSPIWTHLDLRGC